MAVRKLNLEEAMNMPCAIPDSVIEQSVEGLRPILEKHGLIPLDYDEMALNKQLDEASAKPIFNSKEMLSGGVWISPQGDIFGVPLTHVRAVIEDPEKFGVSIDQIKAIFNKHNEGIGSEGAARDEIVSLLISNGWVRIRYYPGEFFRVELATVNQNYTHFLSSWASKVIAKDDSKRSFKVVIYETFEGGSELSFTLEELQGGINMKSGRR